MKKTQKLDVKTIKAGTYRPYTLMRRLGVK